MNDLLVLLYAITGIGLMTVATAIPSFVRRCAGRHKERKFAGRACSDKTESRRWRRHHPVLIWKSSVEVAVKPGFPGYISSQFSKRTPR